MIKLYIWKDGEIHVLNGYDVFDQATEYGLELRQKYLNCPMFDPVPTEEQWKCGVLLDKSDRNYPYWHYLPKKEFPKEFLLELLVMGIAI